MILITGGSFQGKRDFAAEKILNVQTAGASGRQVADGAKAETGELIKAGLLTNYHLLIKRQLLEDEDPIQAAADLLKINPDLVIIADELGCGIVPVDPFDRAWREAVGRCCCYLAERADEVWRVTCGIGVRIK